MPSDPAAGQPSSEWDRLAAAYVRIHAAFLNWVRSRTGDWTTAEDVAQEAVVQLFEQHQALDFGNDPDEMLRRLFGWLKRVADRKWIDVQRRHRRVVGLDEYLPDHGPGPAGLLIEREKAELTTHAVEQVERAWCVVPPDMLRVIEMVLQGRAVADVARELGIDPVTARTRKFRGLELLRAELAKSNPDLAEQVGQLFEWLSHESD